MTDLSDNYITDPMLGLENLLLLSTTFVSSTGLLTTEKVSEERIHWGMLENDVFRSKAKRPLAVIHDTEATGWKPEADSDGARLFANGSVELYLSDTTKNKENHELSMKAFASWAGSVIQEIAKNNGIENNYYFNGIHHATRCLRSPERFRADHDFFFLLVELTFGPGGRY